MMDPERTRTIFAPLRNRERLQNALTGLRSLMTLTILLLGMAGGCLLLAAWLILRP